MEESKMTSNSCAQLPADALLQTAIDAGVSLAVYCYGSGIVVNGQQFCDGQWYPDGRAPAAVDPELIAALTESPALEETLRAKG
jgi:hypothetical protein